MPILRGISTLDAAIGWQATPLRCDLLSMTMQSEDSNKLAESLDAFLASVESDAYRLALAACKDPDDAIDLVQETMLTLVQKYRHKSAENWPPLLHRILQNKIRDWYRRRSVKHTLLKWSGLGDTGNIITQLPAPARESPSAQVDRRDMLTEVELAIGQLPHRQQQVFMLRCWKEMSVGEVATVMSISTGSVKTHYSRALATLRKVLGPEWGQDNE